MKPRSQVDRIRPLRQRLTTASLSPTLRYISVQATGDSSRVSQGGWIGSKSEKEQAKTPLLFFIWFGGAFAGASLANATLFPL